MFLFKPRQDVVFAAIDESQYIRLFEEGNDFELCVEDNNTYTGTFSIKNDTVILLYLEQIDFTTNHRISMQPDDKKNLPGKLFINKSASKIKSTDERSFSAEIYLDLRQKLYKPAPGKVRMLNIQQDEISALEVHP